MQPIQLYQNLQATAPTSRTNERLLTILDYQYKRIALPISDGYRMIPISKISYIKSSSNYSEIHLHNGDNILTSKTLKYWENKIDHAFFLRCHHSYLLNKDYVTSVDVKSGVICVNGIDLPVARSRKSTCYKMLLE